MKLLLSLVLTCSCSRPAGPVLLAELDAPVGSAFADLVPAIRDAAVEADDASSDAAAALSMVQRSGWRASPAIPSRMKPNPLKPRLLTIHHSAARNRPGQDDGQVLAGIQAYQVQVKHWGDLAYHYFVGPSGALYEGRSLRYAADTTTHYDPTGHITVCVLGNFEEEEPTRPAKKALVELVVALLQKHGLSPADVRLHREVAQTLCPGKTLREWWRGPSGPKVGERVRGPRLLVP